MLVNAIAPGNVSTFRASTFYISSPASHGVHLQVDVLNVAKGSEVLFDVGVLGLLGWKKSKTSKNFLFLVNKQLFTNKQEFVITLYRRPNIDILVALRRQ